MGEYSENCILVVPLKDQTFGYIPTLFYVVIMGKTMRLTLIKDVAKVLLNVNTSHLDINMYYKRTHRHKHERMHM